jgi:hypothetical protein
MLSLIGDVMELNFISDVKRTKSGDLQYKVGLSVSLVIFDYKRDQFQKGGEI